MIKAETIAQFEGFGNNIQEKLNEYYRASGFSKSANGITANKYLSNWYNSSITSLYPQYSTIGTIGLWASGFGRDLSALSGSDSMVYGLDTDGKLFGSLGGSGTPQLLYHVNRNSSYISTGAGMIVDQKKRLLICGQRYITMFNPATSDVVYDVTVTNGSASVTVDSNNANADHVEKLLRLYVSGKYYYYRVKTRTFSNAITVYGTIDAPSGTYTGNVLLYSFNPEWKDFGSNKTTNSEGNAMYFPSETYEDTVLFGRGSNIVTLNTLTDSITTDASPAFTLPTAFDILSIHKGVNGIMIGTNFQRKGVLILWDNFSDRSIAPWINLPDRLLSMCKYNGGWLVITSREILFTDGYSLTSIKKLFLDTNKTVFVPSLIPQTSVVVEDHLHFLTGYTASGKRRAGLNRMNLSSVSRLVEFYPRASLDQYNYNLKSIFYDSGNGDGRLFAGTTTGIDYLLTDSEPPVAVYITNPIGKGENFKHAEALKVNLGVSPQDSSKQSPYSFKVIAKICPMEKQLYNVGVVKTTMADTTHVVVNESTYHIASVGDEIEFLDGESAGYSRNITAITGSGTSTATYTLDRALPYVVSANYHFFITAFRLIKVKSYTSISSMPEVYFDIKNRPKGKKFLIKIEIEGADVPVELRPMVFVYDDMGVI